MPLADLLQRAVQQPAKEMFGPGRRVRKKSPESEPRQRGPALARNVPYWLLDRSLSPRRTWQARSLQKTYHTLTPTLHSTGNNSLPQSKC